MMISWHTARGEWLDALGVLQDPPQSTETSSVSSSPSESSKENSWICNYTDREKVLYLLLYTI
jgi:hypothetical protein